MMWRMVETIRNKSTILKSRKLNMEKNGQPSTLHMEIIEEEPVQENYGTDFKKTRRSRNREVEENSEKSNQSSPEVK